jgi:hypothetical protein
MGHRRMKVLAVLAAVAGLLAATTAVVRAELTSSGNLFITFDGDIEPEALPRGERAPVALWVAGRVRTLSGEKPPSLREITIGVHRDGHLETRGLPTCSKNKIDLLSSEEALEACADALVGSGTYRARTTFPEQSQTPSHGRILAFNARVGGRSVILGHVYGDDPVPASDVIVFEISHPSGTFGTELHGNVPESLSRWGYLKRISLRLQRKYTYRGERRSYMSASCRAPRGLDKAAFKFAFASLVFDDGRTLSSTITRTCRVKGSS